MARPPRTERPAARAALAALILLGALALPAAGHELGVVWVNAVFLHDGTYRVELAVDNDLFPEPADPAARLDPPPAGLALLDGLKPRDRERFEAFLTAFVAAAEPAFDGRRVAPAAVEITSVELPTIKVSLSGPIPAGAHAFTWADSLPIGQYLVTLGHEGDAGASRQWLEAGRETDPFALDREVVPPTRAEVIRLYLALGFTHIMPKGLDHILFVLGIFLLSRRLKPVLAQVTAFTAAHTLTLALSSYGIVRLPPAVVEPLIALSIVYVAVENVLSERLRPSRVAVVFAFGLLHGLGFAGVLAEIGLPRREFLTALLSFNAGVEGGQLAVISAAWLAVALPWSGKAWYRHRVVVPASLAIAAVGLFWAVERTLL